MSKTTSDPKDASSSLYHIELLKEDNWLPWKRCVISVLRDRHLLKYVEGKATKPVLPQGADSAAKMAHEKELDEWEDNDVRAQTQIELTLSDPQMIHFAGAKNAIEMWKQLCSVKEARGRITSLM